MWSDDGSAPGPAPPPPPPPSHQHRGDSHDRIFGGFTFAAPGAGAEDSGGRGAEDAPPPPPPQLQLPGHCAAPAGRRRRWVRTRTQHLSTLNLQAEDVGDHLTTESASYGAAAPLTPPPPPPPPLASDGEDAAAPVVAAPCGRYAYRRPDGNPVTGEGYSRLGSCDLQVSTRK